LHQQQRFHFLDLTVRRFPPVHFARRHTLSNTGREVSMEWDGEQFGGLLLARQDKLPAVALYVLAA
jgi:hypothetical protein